MSCQTTAVHANLHTIRRKHQGDGCVRLEFKAAEWAQIDAGIAVHCGLNDAPAQYGRPAPCFVAVDCNSAGSDEFSSRRIKQRLADPPTDVPTGWAFLG